MIRDKAGRPPFEVTDAVLAQIEEHASNGLNKGQISKALGISHETYTKYQALEGKIEEVYERGRAKGVAKIAASLNNAAFNGNVVAMIFFLKAVGGWRENNVLELTGADGKPIQIDTKYTNIDALMNQRFSQLLNKDKEITDERGNQPE